MFKNTEQGIEQFINNMLGNKNIAVLFDADVDGLYAGKIITEYIRSAGMNCSIYMNEDKSHGLNKEIMNWCLTERVDYLIIVDAGTNDEKFHDLFIEKGISLLILDHHDINIKEVMIPKKERVVINCKQDKSPNTELSGAGVVYKFIRQLDKKLGVGGTEKYKKWVGITVLSDSCNILNKENRYFVNNLFKEYENDMLFSKFKNYGSVNNMFNFKIIPLLNACMRMAEINLVFDLVFTSTSKTLDTLLVQAEKVQTKQKEEVDKALQSLKMLVGKNFVFSRVDDENTRKSIIGLIANKIREKYNKASIVVRKDGRDYKGSFRGIDNIDNEILKDLGIKVEGHKKACGVEIKEEQFKEVVKTLLHKKIEREDGVAYDYELIEGDYIDKKRTLNRIAFLNEWVGNGFDKVRIKIIMTMAEPDLVKYEKVKRYRHIYFEVVDFDVENNTRYGSELIAYPCLKGDSFTLVKD